MLVTELSNINFKSTFHQVCYKYRFIAKKTIVKKLTYLIIHGGMSIKLTEILRRTFYYIIIKFMRLTSDIIVIFLSLVKPCINLTFLPGNV